MCLNFTVIVKDELTGKSKLHELVANGRNVMVTEANKEDYIRKM